MSKWSLHGSPQLSTISTSFNIFQTQFHWNVTRVCKISLLPGCSWRLQLELELEYDAATTKKRADLGDPGQICSTIKTIKTKASDTSKDSRVKYSEIVKSHRYQLSNIAKWCTMWRILKICDRSQMAINTINGNQLQSMAIVARTGSAWVPWLKIGTSSSRKMQQVRQRNAP